MTDGGALAAAFHADVVRPLVARGFPSVPVGAALWGPGSEVLGFDDDRSHDHDWGPRLQVFAPRDLVEAIDAMLARELPARFRGLPVRYATTGDADARHRVAVSVLGDFCAGRLGFDPRAAITAEDWLQVTGQAVLEVVAGPVLADPDGALGGVRQRLARSPEGVRRVAVAADWLRLDDELPLLGRAGETGDDLGSRVIAGRLACVAMHLAFLLDERWAPYPKWFGRAFAALPSAPMLLPGLRRALEAEHWRERQAAFAGVLASLGELQAERLGGPAAATAAFFDRPFLRISPGVAGAVLRPVTDPDLLAALPGGTAEQRTDRVPLLLDPAARRALVRPSR